jgi:mannosyltransferase OCH1-like enzyme
VAASGVYHLRAERTVSGATIRFSALDLDMQIRKGLTEPLRKAVHNWDDASILRKGSLGETFALPHESEPTYTVPKNLHFIWVGSKLPDRYRANVQSFSKLNPDFNIHLWVDHPCELRGVASVRQTGSIVWSNQGLFAAESNMGAKADIIRYEIVERCGGIYCDIDTVCMRPLDELFARAFVAAHLGPPWHNVTNALFGFPKGSKFLDFVTRCLGLNLRQRPYASVPARTGPTFFTTCLLSYCDREIRLIDQAELNGTPHSYMHHTLDANWAR